VPHLRHEKGRPEALAFSQSVEWTQILLYASEKNLGGFLYGCRIRQSWPEGIEMFRPKLAMRSPRTAASPGLIDSDQEAPMPLLTR
jgi:hypothetical protein